MGKSYLILVFGLGLFGAIAQNLGSAPAEGERADIMQVDSDLGDKGTSGSKSSGTSDGLVLDRQSDGHFYADVRLNGSTVRMLVDTGASGIALSSEDARRAGIATSIGMSDHIGEGAGGAVYGDVIKIGRVELGDVEQKDVRAVVLNGGDTSLLGQSFLGDFASVSIEGDRMTLR